MSEKDGKMIDERIKKYRESIDGINREILELLNKRIEIVQKIGRVKETLGIEKYDPIRESEMLKDLLEQSEGPMKPSAIKSVFKQIFQTSLDMVEEQTRTYMLVSRKEGMDRGVKVGDVTVGGGKPIIIAGPCAVETPEQYDRIAGFLKSVGVRFIRGGAFKPRTSPYSFQGLGLKGLEIIRETVKKYDMLAVSEVMDTRHIEAAYKALDVFQIGARNMANFELLKAVGQTDKPILLKRGYMSTIEEFLLAAEYILSQGNKNLILCERGIRTFEKWTRNTLDISAVPILKNETYLPVITDVSHSAGRRDILTALARASLAAGSDGVMIEVHDLPETALSDSDQQADFGLFREILKGLEDLL